MTVGIDKRKISCIIKGGIMDKSIKCDCGKLIAKVRNGKLYVWCKNCKREVEIKIEYPKEPLSRESK